MSEKLRSAGADAAWLTIGTALSALAVYVFLGIGTRAIGADGFAPVSVLWSLWAVSGAALTFPVQHWLIQSVESTGSEGAVWRALPRVYGVAGLAGVLAFGGSWLVATPLFGVHGVAFPIMAGLLPLASVAMGVNRGMMSARGEFRGTAMAILGENLIRVVAAFALGPRVDAVGFGWILMCGFLIAAAFPRSFRRRGEKAGGGSASISLLGGLTGANMASQTVLTIGPVLVSILGGAPTEVTAIFAVLALLRAPYTVALGASARLTAPLARHVATGDAASLRRGLITGVCAFASMSLVAGALAPVLLPAVVRAVFDVPDVLSKTSLGMLAAGSVLALGNLLLMLALLAMQRSRSMMAAWGAAIVVGGVVLLVGDGPVTQVATAFALAEVVAMVGMVGSMGTLSRHRGMHKS